MITLLKKIYALLPENDGWKLASLFLMMLVASVLELMGVGLIPVFVAILADPDRLLETQRLAWLWDRFNVTDFDSLFYFGAGSLLIIYILKNLFIAFYHYVEGRYIWNRYKYISSNLFRKYLEAPYTFHLNRNSSVILRNVTEEGRYLVRDILAPIIKLSMNSLVVLAILLLLIVIEPWITLAVIAVIGGVGGLISLFLKNRVKFFGKQANEARSGMIKSVNEGIGGLKEIRVIRKEPWFLNQFLKKTRDYVRAQTFFTAALYSNKPLMETISIIGILMIAVILYSQGTGTEYLITILALFGSATARLLPAMREIVRDINNLLYYKYSAGAIYEDFRKLQSDPETREAGDQISGADKRYKLKHEISFHDVSYLYPNSEIPAVSRLNFSIKKGEVVGFAGPTGSGKTTIVDLMLGLLKPQHGSIRFDGMDLPEYLIRYRGRIGYIPQFIFFTDDTLLKNIAFGVNDKEIDHRRVEQCIETARLTRVVAELPKGVETVIGERGVRLSGGQRQRIGIARALYQDPDLLIMDEATSALDSRTESEVIEAIEQIRGERTIVMIAHRLSTMEHCDRIYFLQNGRIADSGTLADLMEKNEAFITFSSNKVQM